jgi:MFS family permease
VVRGTPEDVGMLLVLPLLLVGLGSGAFITPNQALSLSAVDPRMGGVAGGVLQMSQRIGSATGQAVLGAVFFATVATGLESGAVPTGAYSRGVWVTVLAMLVFLAAAVLLGVLDLRRARRAGSAES